MFFLPLKVDLYLNRLPFLTFLICVVCIFIYTQQQSSAESVIKSLYSYCDERKSDFNFFMTVEKVQGVKSPDACADILYQLRSSHEPELVINEMTAKADRIESFLEEYSREFIHQQLTLNYDQYTQQYPDKGLTEQLMHDPHTFNITTMITAAFAHGSWMHLIGNLIFFYAFAASVEVALGYLAFTGVFVCLAIGSHFVYSLAMMNVPEALPTIGLSGVVMGMIGMFTYLMPRVNIRCFLWFITVIKIVKTPGWLLAAWYIGWDIYELNHSSEGSNINFIAHVAGAGLGLMLGFILFRQRKREIRQEFVAS